MDKKKLTPKDYDRWDGVVGIRIVSSPNQETDKKQDKKVVKKGKQKIDQK